MKKWPIFLAGTAIAIVGCGGGTGHGGTATAGNGNVVATSGDSIATVNLPTTVALLNIYYLTGQGRAQGDITANLASAELKNTATGADLLDPLPKALNAKLNQFSLNDQLMDLPNATIRAPIMNSLFFTEFDLNVATISVDNGDGTYTVHTGPNGNYFINPTNGGEVPVVGSGGAFSAAIGLFPGRQTSVQLFLNDGSINLDPSASFYQFYRTIFLSNNTSSGNTNITGFLSDYVMFDITHVASQPSVTLADGVTQVPATRVYLGGEDQHYGASTSVIGGPFCVFTPSNVPQLGTFKGQDTLPPPPTGVAPIPIGGTYTLRDPDPRDITGGSLVTSFQGIWRPVTSVFNNLGTFEVITMPHSGENSSPPDTTQDMVVMVRDTSGNITNMYFGLVDLAGLTFTVYPIANLSTGAVNGAITGTVSGLTDGTGAATTIPQNARFGRYAFTGTLPAGFKTTGKFIVFRV